MKRLRENGLSAVILAVFIACMVAQTWTGLRHYNHERRQHGERALALPEYLRSGHFWEAAAENWESEFLQMAAYVLLTVGLYQKGSSESKNPHRPEDVDRDPREATGKRLAEARKSDMDLDALGQRMKARKEQLAAKSRKLDA